MPKFWNMSQNLNNVVNGYKPVQSHRTCGFYCNEVPYLSSDLRSEIWNYVPGFVKYLRSFGLNNTLGISRHSDPFLKDLSLLFTLSKYLEDSSGGNWAGQRQRSTQHFFSQSLVGEKDSWPWDYLSAHHVSRPHSLEPLGTLRVAERSVPGDTIAVLGLWDRTVSYVNLGSTLSEDYLVYISSSLRQWSVRTFQGWFIQLPLSRHQAPGILPVHPL